MKNWALTNWLDWFERQREGRAQKATLEPCKADQRGSPPKAKSGSSLSGLHANILWRSGRRWGGGDRSYRSTKNLVTSQCVTGTLFPSTTPSQVPKAAFLVLDYTYLRPLLGPQSSPLWHKEKQPYPLFSHKGKGRQASLGTTGSQNPLRIRQISEWASPRARPILPNTQDERDM